MTDTAFSLPFQECPLEIGSFGHESGDIQYRWQTKDPISKEDVGLAQYVLVSLYFLYSRRDF